MSNYFLKTLLLICTTAIVSIKAEKMDFSYNLAASQTVCFLEHIGESVQGKSLCNNDSITNTCFNSYHRGQLRWSGHRLSPYNHRSKRQET